MSGNATAIGGADQGGVRAAFSEAGPRCLGKVLLRVNVPFNSWVFNRGPFQGLGNGPNETGASQRPRGKEFSKERERF